MPCVYEPGAALPGFLSAEGHMLQAELPGYAEYTQRVRYRLLPGVW